MKIAVNRCYGGFDLSTEAHLRLIALGIPLYNSWKELDERTRDREEPWIVLRDADEVGTFSKYSDSFSDYQYRTHPLLIQTIGELGERASGRFGDIHVVDIPDDVNWEIDEYDGIETVHEKHRSW